MSVLLLTGYAGDLHTAMAAHTLPLMQRYAKRHGLEVGCVCLGDPNIPASWMKVPAIGAALRTHEAVLWLDCDVVILDSSASVLDDIPADAWQAVVEHETECGLVPNMGVWFVRREAASWLSAARTILGEKHLHHVWWEQAAMLELMGYDVLEGPVSMRTPRCDGCELFQRTAFLDPAWNHHPGDRRQSPWPRFVHVTQYADRLDAVRRLCAASA